MEMMSINILLLLLSLACLAFCQNGMDEDVTRMLNNVANEYEKVAERNGKFLFADYNIRQNIPASPYNDTVEEFDFIVVGSGSAGSIVAARLSENPKWKVLLLEVGKEPSIIMDIPAIAAAFQLTDYNWGYLMEKQDNMCLGMVDQRMAWPRGRGLGGTTVINYMIHVRGNREDYNRWSELNNPGWSYKEILPYFKKMEDSTVAYQDPEFHGRGGPITVQDTAYRSDAVHAFIKSAQEAGHKYVDYNGRKQLGVSYVQATTKRGRRCSVESAYLRLAKLRKNLKISTLSRVTKLVLEDRRVVGVEYVKGRQYHTAKATKEVILSAGAFNSPQILMLSGIGPKSHLDELGIPVVQDLPVGETLYDHLTFLGLLFTVNETITLQQSLIEEPKSLFSLLTNGTGPLTSLGGVEALTYIKTNVSTEVGNYPDIELIFVSGGLHTDSGLVYRKTFRITDEVYNAFWKPYEKRAAWSVLPMLLHPKSKGFLRLKSKNPYHWPKLYGNFFTDKENQDIRTFIGAIREVQKIARSPTFQKYDCRQVRTKIPGCETHEFDTDAYWECALRHVTGTLHHQVGTCKMGPANDPEAVVDHKLKVYGIKGLRVADCSVIPVTLSAHTSVPAMMVGEKAADLIKEEWGMINFNPRSFDPRRSV